MGRARESEHRRAGPAAAVLAIAAVVVAFIAFWPQSTGAVGSTRVEIVAPGATGSGTELVLSQGFDEAADSARSSTGLYMRYPGGEGLEPIVVTSAEVIVDRSARAVSLRGGVRILGETGEAMVLAVWEPGEEAPVVSVSIHLQSVTLADLATSWIAPPGMNPRVDAWLMAANGTIDLRETDADGDFFDPQLWMLDQGASIRIATSIGQDGTRAFAQATLSGETDVLNGRVDLDDPAGLLTFGGQLSSADLPLAVREFLSSIGFAEVNANVSGTLPVRGEGPLRLTYGFGATATSPTATVQEVGLDIGIQYDLGDDSVAFFIEGDMKLRLPSGDRHEIVEFSEVGGSIAVGDDLAFKLSAKMGPWAQPFGLDWLDIGTVMLDLEGPAPLHVGFRADAKLAGRDISLSMALGGGPSPQIGFRFASATGFAVGDLATIARSLAPGVDLGFLGELNNLSLRNVEVAFSQIDAPDLCLSRGLVLAGDLYLEAPPTNVKLPAPDDCSYIATHSDAAGPCVGSCLGRMRLEIGDDGIFGRAEIAPRDFGAVSTGQGLLEMRAVRGQPFKFEMRASITVEGLGSAYGAFRLEPSGMNLAIQVGNDKDLFLVEAKASFGSSPSFKLLVILKLQSATEFLAEMENGINDVAEFLGVDANVTLPKFQCLGFRVAAGGGVPNAGVAVEIGYQVGSTNRSIRLQWDMSKTAAENAQGLVDALADAVDPGPRSAECLTRSLALEAVLDAPTPPVLEINPYTAVTGTPVALTTPLTLRANVDGVTAAITHGSDTTGVWAEVDFGDGNVVTPPALDCRGRTCREGTTSIVDLAHEFPAKTGRADYGLALNLYGPGRVLLERQLFPLGLVTSGFYDLNIRAVPGEVDEGSQYRVAGSFKWATLEFTAWRECAAVDGRPGIEVGAFTVPNIQFVATVDSRSIGFDHVIADDAGRDARTVTYWIEPDLLGVGCFSPGDESASVDVRVSNVAPTATADVLFRESTQRPVAGPPPVDVIVGVRIDDPAGGDDAPYTVTFNWGDGTIDTFDDVGYDLLAGQPLASCNGGFSARIQVCGRHVYSQWDEAIATVTVRDNDGAVVVDTVAVPLPPANDHRSQGFDLVTGQRVGPMSLEGATFQEGEHRGNFCSTGSLWWEWTPSGPGVHRLETELTGAVFVRLRFRPDVGAEQTVVVRTFEIKEVPEFRGDLHLDGVYVVEATVLGNGRCDATDIENKKRDGRVSFVFVADADVPTPPRSPVATPRVGAAELSWGAPVDDGGAPVSYTVLLEGPSGRRMSRVLDSRSLDESGLAPGGWTATVRARNIAGVGEAVSVSFTVPQPPGGGGTGGGGTGGGGGETERLGYWMIDRSGIIYPFGDAEAFSPLSKSTVAFATNASGDGLWVLHPDGSVSALGEATHFGDADLSALASDEFATTIAAAPDGSGYWVFTNFGRALAFGSADLFGDLWEIIDPVSGQPIADLLRGPIVASSPTRSGQGYYMIGSDGGVFTFGDAVFHGSTGALVLDQPVNGIVPDPDGSGYWLIAADGGLFAFDAPFVGSIPGVLPGVPLQAPIIGAVAFADGYLMVGADGGIFNFSSEQFLGSLGLDPPDEPVVGVAAFVSESNQGSPREA